MEINVNDEFVMTSVPGRTFTILMVSPSQLRVKDTASGTLHHIQMSDFMNAVNSSMIMIVDKEKKEQVKEEEKVEEQSSNFFSFDDM
jgi:predicted nucleic acid-binding protein